jgi:hypothetical protein
MTHTTIKRRERTECVEQLHDLYSPPRIPENSQDERENRRLPYEKRLLTIGDDRSTEEFDQPIFDLLGRFPSIKLLYSIAQTNKQPRREPETLRKEAKGEQHFENVVQKCVDRQCHQQLNSHRKNGEEAICDQRIVHESRRYTIRESNREIVVPGIARMTGAGFKRLNDEPNNAVEWTQLREDDQSRE